MEAAEVLRKQAKIIDQVYFTESERKVTPENASRAARLRKVADWLEGVDE